MKRKPTDLRREILAVAGPMFLARGFAGVDMRSIAEQLGLAVGTLYNYFPNKRVLFFEVFEAEWHHVLEQLAAAARENQPVVERTVAFLQQFYQAVRTRRGLGLELLRLTRDTPERPEQIQQVEQQLQQLLTQLLAESGLDHTNCRCLARTLLAGTWSAAKEEAEQGELHFEFVQWLLAHLVPAEGSETNNHACRR